jgi:formylglycine-generating enzyme required for sulfatase activity
VGIVVSGAGVWWWSTSDQAVQTKPEAHSFPVQALRPEPEAPEVKRRPIEAEVDGALIAVSGRYPEPGSVFKDCENCPEMVVVVGGTFNMGSPESEEDRDKDEGPQHEVTIQSFAIGRYEVTFEEWDACVAAGGCSTKPRDVRWGRGKRPVITVGWNDAREYIAWLKEKTNQPYRLSSEAEWEYAARAGTTTPLWTGAMITVDQANYVRNVEKTTEVGAYAANALGLYDTAGNVSEWVEDCWHDNYENAPEDGSAWLKGDCFGRVVRGGSWSSKPKDLRSAARYWSRPNARRPDVGFRVARTLTP